METEIPKAEYEKIADMIQSEESVVGIDARKTHIIIIHKLMELEKKLEALEAKLEKNSTRGQMTDKA